MDFTSCLDFVLGWETRTVHQVPGETWRTAWGITERAHPDWPGWAAIDAGASQAALEGLVQDFYRERYWGALALDTVPGVLRLPLFDAAVNAGHAGSVEFLQQAFKITHSVSIAVKKGFYV